MAKPPGTPKAKTGAPMQFDMNSRERKGGKGGPGGPGRGREDKRPPSRIVDVPPTSVDRGEGWIIQKVGKIDQASHVPVGAEYRLIFDGHEPLVFGFLGAARERAKEPPPEIAPAGQAEAEAVEETTAEPEAVEATTVEAEPVEETSTEVAPAEHA